MLQSVQSGRVDVAAIISRAMARKMSFTCVLRPSFNQQQQHQHHCGTTVDKNTAGGVAGFDSPSGLQSQQSRHRGATLPMSWVTKMVHLSMAAPVEELRAHMGLPRRGVTLLTGRPDHTDLIHSVHFGCHGSNNGGSSSVLRWELRCSPQQILFDLGVREGAVVTIMDLGLVTFEGSDL